MPPSAPASGPVGGPLFLTTRWSVVLAARGDDTAAREALAKLCSAYWFPLYAFVRREGHSPHDAQDLTQEFFARLLEKGWLSGVAQERGHFRSWLLASMRHFLANEWNRAHTQRRGGGVALISIDEATAEARFGDEPATSETAETFYDRQWAVALLDQVMKRLREEYHRSGRGPIFDRLKGALSGEIGAYTEVASDLGLSEGAVKV
ncbi:MAG: sigma-70 family RNA polymerase sigma factor, partial [Chthoniobacteraceae bacterium]